MGRFFTRAAGSAGWVQLGNTAAGALGCGTALKYERRSASVFARELIAGGGSTAIVSAVLNPVGVVEPSGSSRRAATAACCRSPLYAEGGVVALWRPASRQPSAENSSTAARRALRCTRRDLRRRGAGVAATRARGELHGTHGFAVCERAGRRQDSPVREPDRTPPSSRRCATLRTQRASSAASSSAARLRRRRAALRSPSAR